MQLNREKSIVDNFLKTLHEMMKGVIGNQIMRRENVIMKGETKHL